jgi:hypothetical protein
MRRHSLEEITDLKAGLLKSSTLVFFFILSQQTFPQIPINGFCKYDSYQIPPGFYQLLTADINNDTIDDILFYSSDNRKIGICLGEVKGFGKVKEYVTKHRFSRLINSENKKTGNSDFMFTDRKNRLLGVITVPADSTPTFDIKIEFDSFPENIEAGNVNNHRNTEYLISGSGFDGLSILYRNVERFGERKVANNAIYSRAIFTDLSNDGYEDIAAYNLIDNTIQFFFNDGSGNYELVRSIKTRNEVTAIKSADINADSFMDIIFIQNDLIKILLGDFQSSYNKSLSLSTNFTPDKCLVGDFNSDGYHDLAYINKTEGNLSLMFGINNGQYSEEVIYFIKPGLMDIAVYNIGSKTGIALLSSEGLLYTVTSFVDLIGSHKINLVPSIKPSTINFFDAGNNKISDLCFIDNYDNSLKLFVRNEKGIPEKYYSLPVSDFHRNILVDESQPRIKTFYCYSEGNQLIELINYNFCKNEFERKQFYSPGDILDLDFEQIDSTQVNIYITYNKKNKLYVGKFEKRKLSTTFREYPFIDRNVLSAELFLEEEPVLYYWRDLQDSVYFTKAEVKTGPNIYEIYFGLLKDKEANVSAFTNNKFNWINGSIFSMIAIDRSNFAVVSDASGFHISSRFFNEDYFDITNPQHINFSELDKGRVEYLTAYSPEDKSLNKIDVILKGNNYTLTKLLNVEGVADYFIDNFGSENFHFIYSNNIEGCISVVQLKK